MALADGHFHCEISIHALREEGDELYPGQPRQPDRFLSTPSARRATDHPGLFSRGVDISIHALREEGDGTAAGAAGGEKIFLSTPSARRATRDGVLARLELTISIHALREEGDQFDQGFAVYLNQFLSTPSARRATRWGKGQHRCCADFYPRPPRGGRRQRCRGQPQRCGISIHVLREEGDSRTFVSRQTLSNFYPRPPRGGRPSAREVFL